jgi:putative ABC transport system permease protein
MPDWKPHIRSRLASLRLSATRENEIVEELSQHLEDRWQELVAGGTSENEATKLALAGFRDGNLLARRLDRLQLAHAPTPITPGAPVRHMLGDLWQDIRYASRESWRRPGFTVAAVVTLALGIGATTAIFSTVYAVLLQPLPYRDPGRLIAVLKQNPSRGWRNNPVAAADVIAWRDRTRVFEGLAAFTGASCVLTGSGGAEEVPCEVVESRLFPLLGVTPFIGRTFTAEEDAAHGARAAILSHGLWQRRFGADPATVDRAIEINGNMHTIVGVMSAGFSHLYSSPHAPVPQLWISGIGLQATDEWNTYLAVGRFRPGVTRESAQAELDVVSEQVERAHPNLKGWHAELNTLRDLNAGETAPALLVLVGAVIFVLLIGCANVANLLLARATARASEMAVRKALGADRWRVIRQLLTEGALLALAGGALGVIVASWTIRGLLTLAPSYLLNSVPGLSGELDLRILVLAVGISIATTMLFGLAPAWLTARSDLAETLKETARGSMDPRRHRFRSALLVAQLALAMVLLVGAGLMIRTLTNMSAVNLGFNPTGVLTLRVPLEGSRYAEPLRVAAFWRELVRSVERLPGVSSASVTRGLPTESWDGQFFVNADQPNPRAGHVPDANYVVVGPRYFETMQIPLRAGRPFDDHDNAGGLPVVIVNDELARTQWPGQSAIGKRIKMGSPSDTVGPWLTVVGVSASVMTQGPRSGVRAEVYVPYQQFPWLLVPQHLVVRASPGTVPARLTRSIVTEIQRLDRHLPVTHIRTMEEVAALPMGQQRMVMALLGGFAGVALVLAALGIYSVLSYSVGQRQREFGVRVALGAQQADVVRLVLGSGARLVMVGLGTGLTVALLLTRLMTDLLYGVLPADPVTFLAVSVLLATTALVACYVPARRAMRVNPVDVLRHD